MGNSEAANEILRHLVGLIKALFKLLPQLKDVVLLKLMKDTKD